jgi:site-specific recombinase XerC
MKQEVVVFSSNMSYGDLSQLADAGVNTAMRDLNDLSLFGVDLAFIDSIRQKNALFKNFATDEEYSGMVSKRTQEKNDLRNIVTKGISNIMIRVKNKYGANSPEHKRFSTGNMHKDTDSDLVRLARRVTRLASEYLNDLYEKGLRQSEIDGLNEQIDAFDKSIEIKDQVVKERDTATQQRALLANEIYNLVSELFDYGKQCYVDTNEAKYNDYVIYSNQTSSMVDSEEADTTTE